MSECWRGPPTIGKMDRFNTMKVSHYYSLVQAPLKAVKSQCKSRLQIPVNKHGLQHEMVYIDAIMHQSKQWRTRGKLSNQN